METPATLLDYLKVIYKDSRDIKQIYITYYDNKKVGLDVESFVPAMMRKQAEIEKNSRYLINYISNGGSLNG